MDAGDQPPAQAGGCLGRGRVEGDPLSAFHAALVLRLTATSRDGVSAEGRSETFTLRHGSHAALDHAPGESATERVAARTLLILNGEMSEWLKEHGWK